MEPKLGNRGTILRAGNGEVIGYDHTGLILRLSDRVIADIARRIDASGARSRAAPGTGTDGGLETLAPADASVLGDIDAWNVRRIGEWYQFTARLPGAEGARDYRILAERGADDTSSIIAEAPGALLGLLCLGGPRATWTVQRASRFPYHVLGPADDIGAVGMAGSAASPETDRLQGLREVTRDALLAETLLSARWKLRRALPLCFVRAETDGSAAVADLRVGRAYANLVAAARNLGQAAAKIGRPARVLAVRLDFSLEDVSSDATAYRDGMLALMDAITRDLGALGFHKPLFLATFDCGTAEITDHAALRGQWELAWNRADHDLVFAAPGYMFALDEYGRPTPNSALHMAVMDAEAVTAAYEERDWYCPLFLLAEMDGEMRVRVRARAMTGLVIDRTDPFGAGPAAGFRLMGTDGPVAVSGVEVAADDSGDIVLTLDRRPEGKAMRLLYGFGAEPRSAGDGLRGYPAACGAIRDEWAVRAEDDRVLHRWALPCDLPIN